MRKIAVCLLWILLSFAAWAGAISAVKIGRSKITVEFDTKKGEARKPKVEYDSFTRLLYLEFPDTDLSPNVKAGKNKSKYYDDVQVVDHGNSVGVFVTLAKDVTYTGAMKGKSYVVNLDNGQKQYIIAIDAGHGGKDPGAQSRNKAVDEKNLALAVAKLLRNELAEDFKVIMTRDTDVFIPLSERPAIANRVKCDFFISVHINAAPNRSEASGSEIYYFSTEKPSAYAAKIAAFENSFSEYGGKKDSEIKQIMGSLAYKKNQEKSVNFANPTVEAIARSLRLPNKGIHGANFAVLRGFDGPGVLLELGFITNQTDLKALQNPKNQKAVAKAVAEQVREFFE
ncbi:MAG: N-acetylmuramoyl-L-alanine amidase [Fusobacteriaceae bacterium]|nr:N-acetylmuramoyl-L-alanine amidase [Fusobacteriaceae bacterium]